MAALRKILEEGRRIYGKFSEKKFTTIAGTLVYFLIMSLLPFSVWLTLLAGKVIPDFDTLFELEIFNEFKELFLYVQQSARDATDKVSLVFLATTLYSASSLFYHMRKSGEIIYDYHPKRQGLRVRVSAIVLIFIMIALLGLGLAVLVLGNTLLQQFLPTLWRKLAVNALLFFIAFWIAWLLNIYLCPYRLKVQEGIWGSLLTTVLWLIAAYAFQIYLRFSNMTRLYGALANLIVFLLWLYVMTCCFVIGVIFNYYQVSPRRRESKKF